MPGSSGLPPATGTWKALLRTGESVGRDHVKRLMKTAGIQGAKHRGKPWRTTTPDPDPAARRNPDLVERDLSTDRPDQLWVADFTYLRCWESLVFFSFVIDVSTCAPTSSFTHYAALSP